MIRLLFGCLLVSVLLVSSSQAADIFKPHGVYVSHVSANADRYLPLPYVKGALIRVRWSEIEPAQGQYNFARIEQKLKLIKAANKNWSLAVIAGRDVPEWLLDQTNERMAIQFRGNPYQIIPFWSRVYQIHAARLAQALAERYGDDPSLALVYVPQQTANGIEGHFNGTSFEALQLAGLTKERWLSASAAAMGAYTLAFPNKAIAFELHEIYRDIQIPKAIIEYIKKNHTNQVGIGVWWLSGKERYQGKLLQLLKQSDLPVYAQVIGNSSQRHRFPKGDYSKVFEQAESIGARYVEIWNYELENKVSSSVTQAIKTFSDKN